MTDPGPASGNKEGAADTEDDGVEASTESLFMQSVDALLDASCDSDIEGDEDFDEQFLLNVKQHTESVLG